MLQRICDVCGVVMADSNIVLSSNARNMADAVGNVADVCQTCQDSAEQMSEIREFILNAWRNKSRQIAKATGQTSGTTRGKRMAQKTPQEKPVPKGGERIMPNLGPFVGSGGVEKQEIHSRLVAFCTAHNPGGAVLLSKAIDGKLKPETILDMKDAGKYSIEQWRTVKKALDKAEKAEEPT